MGNGIPRVTEEGTTPRIDHAPPGVIGLDSRSGTARGSSASIAEQVLSFVRRRRGRRVGDGECFTLVDQALRGAGAKSAEDYGTVTPDADYVWGAAPVSLRDLQSGDVIQFRDYRYDRRVDERHPDGSESWNEDSQERPHHTAVVERVGSNGEVIVLEQNAPEGSAVTRNTLFFSNRDDSRDGRTVRIRVSGSVWFYRPQPR